MTTQVSNYEQAVIDGIEAREARDGAQWTLGDLALLVETRYAEHTLEEYADAIGEKYSNLLAFRTVAKAYEFSSRLENLTWTHHQAIAARDDRIGWLAAASEYGWSIRKMLEEIETADAEAEKERQKQARAEAFKQRLKDAELLDRWKPGENDQEMLEELARIQEEEREQEQAKLDYEGRIKRARERLSQLLLGWIELEALPDNPDREAILEGLNKADRYKVEEIESIYRRCGDGRNT